jgi:galactose mutarotase-like enzyme
MMEHLVTDTSLDSLRLLQLENDRMSLSILPEVGAKILTLFDKKSSRNILWENPRIRPQSYPIDANFDNYWCGGWDDAYPTADACVHAGEPFPNLGELRSLRWEVVELKADESKATAKLSAFGPISAIKAVKTISLTGQEVQMTFAIESLSPIALDFLWGTHPAFAVEAGTRLMIPARTGIVAQSNHPSLGAPGDRYAWPLLNGRDMSIVPDISAGINCGHYATDLEDGWFAVETKGQGILYEFPLETCPHLWLWLVYGGWRGYHHAVVEPWTGYPVNLAQAFEQGRHSQLAPGKIFSATVRCTPYSAPENCGNALRRIRTPILEADRH